MAHTTSATEANSQWNVHKGQDSICCDVLQFHLEMVESYQLFVKKNCYYLISFNNIRPCNTHFLLGLNTANSDDSGAKNEEECFNDWHIAGLAGRPFVISGAQANEVC